jgi:hypothetical protein
MNRVLRRPMFRMGGSTEGITSGLDAPNVDVRQNYERAGKVVPFVKNPFEENRAASMPSLKSDTPPDELESRYNRAMEFIKSKQTPRRSDLNDFLINLGLNLVSQPSTGNIFADIGQSARAPYARFAERKSTARQEQDKLSQALIGDIMDQMSTEKKADVLAKADIESAKIAAEAKIKEAEIEAKTGQDQFAFEKQQAAYNNLIKQQRELENQKDALIKQKPTTEELGQIDTVIDTTQLDAQIAEIDKRLEDNAKLQALYSDSEKDLTRQALLKAIGNGQYTFEDLIVYDQTGQLPTEESGFKTGGRVGLQEGGQPMQASMNMDQAPAAGMTADSVQKLSFEELRSRLPNIITDDIVTLIANSEQALVDFANIQTQQDVNAFNQKYEVNLQMPPEA